MEKLAFDIASKLLKITKKKYDGNYSAVRDVKLFWHNLFYLIISKANCLYLCKKNICTLEEFVELGILPSTVLQFEYNNSEILGMHANEIANQIVKEYHNLSVLREFFLGIELCVSKTGIVIRQGKTARDTIGSYYTPNKLAKAVVDKTFSQQQTKFIMNKRGDSVRIADLSCGGGEFFWATQEYLMEEYKIPYETSSLYFWGMDVDPIALQITICRLFDNSEFSNWKTIVSHFKCGNPLVATFEEGSIDDKNILFAHNRIYASEMGINYAEKKNDLHFDIILGNPPWEKIRFEERKFFTCYVPEIASMSKNDNRELAIQNLKENWDDLYNWVSRLSSDYAVMCSTKYVHPYIKKSVSGELNTYSLFTELTYNMLTCNGICSLIVKSTLATTPAHKKLWSHLLSQKAIHSLYFFENKKKIFNIDSRERFAVITLTQTKRRQFSFSAGLLSTDDLYTCSDVLVNKNDIAIINPITNMLPNISSTEDLKVLLDVHNRLALFEEVYSNCHFGRLIHLTAHAKQIDTKSSKDNIAIYEGKFIEQYDARFSTFANMPDDKKYAAKASANKNVEINGVKPIPESRYFVHKQFWEKYTVQYNKDYSLCWRSLTSPTNARTTIAMILPCCPMCQSIQMLQTEDNIDLLMLLGLFNSLPFDYFVRLKMPGIDLTQNVIRQIPVPLKNAYEQQIIFNGKNTTLKTHILSCIYWLLKKEDMLSGLLQSLEGIVYRLEDDISRTEIRKLLDKMFARAYQISDQAYEKIIETFPNY